MQILKKLAVAGALAAALPTLVLAQTSPHLTQGQVLTPAQWNNLFASKQDTLGYVPMNLAGGTFSGRIVTAPPGPSTSGFNLTPGTTPAAPANGDLWVTSGGLFARVSGTTVGPLTGATGGSFAATAPIAVSFPSSVVTYSIANGTSVANPGTGTLEALLPIQTTTGASKTFAASDLFKETRRSNSGSAMTDTFPASSATGMVNGAKIVVTNVDATASDTITAGAGTTIGGAGVVAAGRAIQFVYDAPNTIWRPTLNTGTALLGPVTNNAVLIGSSPSNVIQYASPVAVQGCLSSTGTGTPPSFGSNTTAQCGPVTYTTTIAGLRAITAGVTPVAEALGYYIAGDGGRGSFRWDGTSAAADNGGTVIQPNSLPATGRWLRNYEGSEVNVQWFGAKCDGSTNDRVAIQAALDLSSTGQTITTPASECRVASPGVSAAGKNNIKIVGLGAGASSATNSSVSAWVYTSATGTLLNADGANGLDIGNIRLGYNNVAYNGILVDVGGTHSGALYTINVHIHDCGIGGVTGATGAASLVSFNNALNSTIDHCYLTNGAQHITGGIIANNIGISRNWFNQIASVSHIGVGGQGWVIENNVFEPISGTLSNNITALAALDGLLIAGNTFNDSGSGTIISLTGAVVRGLAFTGNQIQGGGDSIDVGSAIGVSITGNRFQAQNLCNLKVNNASNVTATGNSNVGQLVCVLPNSNTPFIVDEMDGVPYLRMSGLGLVNPLTAPNGGTGLATYAIGDLLYADTTSTLARLADVATGNALISGGIGASFGWGKIGISTHVSGLGTGIATALGLNVGSAGAPVLFNGLGGTPSSITLTNGTGLPTTGLTGTLQAAQEPAHTGDVTNTAGSLITLLANIPTGVPAAGSILFTNIAAPSSPASGKVSVYADSTDLRFHDKNASGVIGTTVVADTGASNNFLTAINAAGAISKAQPAFSNLSGTISVAQVGGSGASHAIPVDVAGTITWKVVADCNGATTAANYTQSTDAWSCNSSINAATLGGATFAAPGAIGGGTPSTGAFTTLANSGVHTVTNTTNSTSVSTGALVVSGGAAINKSLTLGAGTGTVSSGPVPDLSVMSANGVLELNLATGGNNPYTFLSSDGTSYFIFDTNRRTATGIFQNTSGTHQRLELLGGNGSGSIIFAATNTNNAQAPTVFTVLGSGDTLTAGHVLATGTAPTASSCGVSPSVSGSDNFGTVTAGSGALASCVINFGKTWGTAPRCVASFGTAVASPTVSASTTQLTVGGTSLTSVAINWVCGSTASLSPPMHDNDNMPGVLSRLA